MTGKIENGHQYCPHCGCMDFLMAYGQVICKRCAARGPRGDNESMAIYLHGQRFIPDVKEGEDG